MSLSARGKITFLPEKLTRGMTRAVFRHVKRTAEKNADMIRASLDNSKNIKDRRRNLEPILESTKKIRRKRGMNRFGDKPLMHSGNLRNSIVVKAEGNGYIIYIESNPEKYTGHGISANVYGHNQNEGFITKGFIKGRNVPARPFFNTPKRFFQSKEYKNLLEILKSEVDEEVLKSARKVRIG